MSRSIAAAALAASYLFACLPAAAQEIRADQRPTITVMGQGKSKSVPELARISAVVETRSGTLGFASETHAKRAAEAASILSGLSGKGVRVREGQFSLVVERQPWVPGQDAEAKGRASDAVATTRFEIEVSPTAGIDAVLAKLAESGLFEMRGVAYDVVDRSTHLDAARRDAMADAIRQARLYAEAGGFSLGAMQSVRDGQAAILDRVAPMAMRSAMAEGSVQASAPDTIDADASVSVTWLIEGGTPAQRKP